MLRGIAFSCVVLLSAARASDSKTAGISQFWTDDYKVFDQIYGKTSDKELYGATLPPSYVFGLDLKKTIQADASDKRERHLTNGKNILDFNTQPYNIDDGYANLFAKSLYSEKIKPSSALQFISFSDIKPISKTTDPETYNYLKHLEQSTKEKNVIKKKIKNNFKPYTILDSDVEAAQAYISVQDILDAHEANKGNGSNEEDEELNLRSKGKKHKTNADNEGLRYSRSRNRSKARLHNGSGKQSKCISGRCRAPSGVRVYARPYIRKIEHYRYSKR